MSIFKIRKGKIKNKKNIFLLILLTFVFFELGLLLFGIASKEKNATMQENERSLSVSDIQTTIETTISSIRYKIEMKFTEDKKINIYEVTEDEKRLRYLIAALGSKKIMEMLLEETEGGTTQDCHQQAHIIGRVSYRVFKGKVFRDVNYDCHSGYLHGAIEEFLNQTGTENIAENIDEMCSGLENSFFRFECLHGSGHGMMAVNNYDIKGAIADCKRLSDSFAQTSCYGGVFMENVIASQGIGAYGHVTKWVNDDPHFPCTVFLDDQDVLYQCYQMQTSRMLDLYGYDFAKVASECMNAPKNMVTACFRSYGRDVAGNVLRNPTAIIEKCSFIKNGEHYETCIDGALWVIMDFWGPNLDSQATELCKLVKDGEYKIQCFRGIAGRIRELGFDVSKQKRICEGFGAGYKQLCSYN